MQTITLKFNQISVERGDRHLFTRLSGSVSTGELMRVAGSNGCGKTTLLRSLCGLYTPDSGEIQWDGCPIDSHYDRYCRQLLYLGHLNCIKANLSPIENLKISTSLNGERFSNSEITEALSTMGLSGFEYLPSYMLSQGQKRRVALTRLLLNTAKLWVLDEPFVALDTQAVDHLQGIVSDHLKRGGLAIITTHQETTLTRSATQTVNLG